MKQRIVTGVVGGILFLFLVYVGNVWYSLLLLLLALLGLYEFLQMAGIRVFSLPGILGYALMLSILWPQLFFLPQRESMFTLVLMPVTILLLLYSVFRKNKFHVEHAALTILGALYIGYGFFFMALARHVAENGFFLTILVFLGIWATDSGAYFVGKAVGRRKLWPEISPNKTVEGSIGGLVAAVLVVLAANGVLGAFPVTHALILALVSGVTGQAGDLIESALKRHFGVKDSGKILPGHGGVLDRTDSWLIVFPILHLMGII
ncbi:phosphatidate cytidylyltransferase [Brevibacillus sp. SYP-B805]|uniref:phosphatidate cytidylyltransferase n=1 Tax=Brevibacillus sp. SYP-B805 TaxID=1578199 RepID=UPI0013EBD6A1|nr:phosphatidate cytidylyltransferase [Brevibacillus sp. SYP-B805]NGQ94043.1 phosphatidate cytidylyltransferase [Brevibacillus sp. SYP-B805]